MEESIKACVAIAIAIAIAISIMTGWLWWLWAATGDQNPPPTYPAGSLHLGKVCKKTNTITQQEHAQSSDTQ